jgi:hypothetical protein
MDTIREISITIATVAGSIGAVAGAAGAIYKLFRKEPPQPAPDQSSPTASSSSLPMVLTLICIAGMSVSLFVCCGGLTLVALLGQPEIQQPIPQPQPMPCPNCAGHGGAVDIWGQHHVCPQCRGQRMVMR